MKASLIKKEHTNLFSAVSETQPTGAKPAGKMRPGSGPKVAIQDETLSREVGFCVEHPTERRLPDPKTQWKTSTTYWR